MFSRLATKMTQRVSTISSRNISRASAWGKNVQDAWLSDASTYPIIAICGIAAIMSISWMSYTVLYNPDVQVRPSIRGHPRRNYLPTDTVPAILSEEEVGEVDEEEISALNDALEALKEAMGAED